MRYKELGKTGLKVSVVGMGTWPISNQYWGPTESEQSLATLKEALDCGINLIDTAPCYGDGLAERLIGEAVKGRRDKAVIATKCGLYRVFGNEFDFGNDLRPAAIRHEIECSLKRLGTDYIDIYQIHFPDPQTPMEATFAELEKLRAEGKFKCLGISNFNFDQTEAASKLAKIDCMQPRYSLLSRESERLNRACLAHGIGVLSYGSLDGGILTGKHTKVPEFKAGDMRYKFYHYFQEPLFSQCMRLVAVLREIAEAHGKPVSHVAINWVAQQEFITSTLCGAKKPEQIRENAAAGDWELSTAELKRISDTYDGIFGKFDSTYVHGGPR